jgi:hypothetical protein
MCDCSTIYSYSKPIILFYGGAMNKIYKLTDEDFIKIVINNKSYSDILRVIGLTPKGGTSSKLLKRRITELNINIEHFDTKKGVAPDSRKYKLEDILIQDSTYQNITSLKRRLVSSGKLKYECAICKNNGEWQGQTLVLQLDHINGVNNDHRLENLRFLCPNCHSLTDTYAGKNNTGV